ncbi:unnamed protein product, partial [Iphiclides podalirius]
MKLSCALVLTLTNLVIATPFSFSVKGSGSTPTGTFGIVQPVAAKTSYSGGFSKASSSSSARGFVPPTQAVGQNVAVAPQAFASAVAEQKPVSQYLEPSSQPSVSQDTSKTEFFVSNVKEDSLAEQTPYKPNSSSDSNTQELTPINPTVQASLGVYDSSKQSNQQSWEFNEKNGASQSNQAPYVGGFGGPSVSSNDAVYLGGFGGPSGVLKPNEYVKPNTLGLSQSENKYSSTAQAGGIHAEQSGASTHYSETQKNVYEQAGFQTQASANAQANAAATASAEWIYKRQPASLGFAANNVFGRS